MTERRADNMQSLEQVDHEALMTRLKWEEDMLAKALKDLSKYELGVIRDILGRRIQETRGSIGAGIDLLNVQLAPHLQRTREELMGQVHEVTKISEARLEKYIDDLRIVHGLLLADQPDEQKNHES